jgi:hypothetical protein
MATITKNEQKNGIEIIFPEKPAIEVIAWLKEHSYRFSAYNKMWWKRFNEADFEEAKKHFK